MQRHLIQVENAVSVRHIFTTKVNLYKFRRPSQIKSKIPCVELSQTDGTTSLKMDNNDSSRQIFSLCPIGVHF
jgi:hypothetical protein